MIPIDGRDVFVPNDEVFVDGAGNLVRVGGKALRVLLKGAKGLTSVPLRHMDPREFKYEREHLHFPYKVKFATRMVGDILYLLIERQSDLPAHAAAN